MEKNTMKYYSKPEEKWLVWLKSEKINNRDFEKYVKKSILKKEGNRELFKEGHLKKAYHNLDFAMLIVRFHEGKIEFRYKDETYYDWLIIASYYAIYHACLALLAEKGFSSKNHYATLCAIIKYYYHKSKKLTEEEVRQISKINFLEEVYIKEFVKAKEKREEATYTISIIYQKVIAEIIRNKAIEFVNKAREILEA